MLAITSIIIIILIIIGLKIFCCACDFFYKKENETKFRCWCRFVTSLFKCLFGICCISSKNKHKKNDIESPVNSKSEYKKQRKSLNRNLESKIFERKKDFEIRNNYAKDQENYLRGSPRRKYNNLHPVNISVEDSSFHDMYLRNESFQNNDFYQTNNLEAKIISSIEELDEEIRKNTNSQHYKGDKLNVENVYLNISKNTNFLGNFYESSFSIKSKKFNGKYYLEKHFFRNIKNPNLASNPNLTDIINSLRRKRKLKTTKYKPLYPLN